MGQGLEACAQAGGLGQHVIHKGFVHGIQHGQRTGADHRVAAESGTVGAGTHMLGNLGGHQHGADGQAAAQALGQRDDVRVQVKMLTGQELAGAAYAGLYLVHDEHQVALFAELGHLGHVVGIQRHHAAFSLDQLQHDGADGVVGSIPQGGKITGGYIGKVVGERSEILVEHILAGGGQGGQRAAVERVYQRDDLVAGSTISISRIFAGGLDGALVGLGTGVAKENGIHAGAAA